MIELISSLPVISFLTTALEAILDAIGSDYIEIAFRVFGPLTSIAVSIFGIMIALGKAEVSDIFYRTLFVCGYFFFIQNYEQITSGLLDFFCTAGVIAGGGYLEADFLYDPSDLIARGLLLGVDFAIPDDFMELFHVVDDLFRFVVALMTFLCFVFLALTDFFFVVEYYIVTTLLLILFPFGIIPSLGFLSESVIATLFKLNCKILTFSFVVSLALDLLENEFTDLLSQNPSFEECLVTVFCTIIIGLTAWRVPNIAASMITGSPSLNAQSISRTTFLIAKTAASKGTSMIKK